MTLQELSAVLQSGALQKKEGEAVIVILNTGKDSQDLRNALMSSLVGEKGVCDIVVGTVNQMHATLRDSLHEVFSEKGVITKFVPGVKGGEA